VPNAIINVDVAAGCPSGDCGAGGVHLAGRCGPGTLAAYALISANDWAWRWPDLVSLAIIAGGILAAVLAAVPLLSLLNATTRHETVRYE
jgi:hypothetical protein